MKIMNLQIDSFHLQFFVSTKDGFRRLHVHVFGEGGNQVYESDISFNFIRDDIFRLAFWNFGNSVHMPDTFHSWYLVPRPCDVDLPLDPVSVGASGSGRRLQAQKQNKKTLQRR